MGADALIAAAISLFGGKGKAQKPLYELVDAYVGEGATVRDAITRAIEDYMAGVQTGEYPGGELMGESADVYRKMLELAPGSEDYLKEVVGGKYLDIASDPYYRNLTRAIAESHQQSIRQQARTAATAAAMTGGGGMYGMGLERALRENLPSLNTALANLAYQSRTYERSAQQEAANLLNNIFGIRTGAYGTAAAGLGELGTRQAGIGEAAMQLGLGLLPYWRSDVVTGGGYAPSAASQVGGSLMEYAIAREMARGNQPALPPGTGGEAYTTQVNTFYPEGTSYWGYRPNTGVGAGAVNF